MKRYGTHPPSTTSLCGQQTEANRSALAWATLLDRAGMVTIYLVGKVMRYKEQWTISVALIVQYWRSRAWRKRMSVPRLPLSMKTLMGGLILCLEVHRLPIRVPSDLHSRGQSYHDQGGRMRNLRRTTTWSQTDSVRSSISLSSLTLCGTCRTSISSLRSRDLHLTVPGKQRCLHRI